MPLLAIPNVSVGVRNETLEAAVEAVVGGGARVLDVHSDANHGRSALTATADRDTLVGSMVALAEACKKIDLTRHTGVHPRVGALDVCPFVPYRSKLSEAVEAARTAARAIAGAVEAPVFLYGAASTRAQTRELPDIRRGGLTELARRMREGLLPDEGPATIDPRYGVVVVGARGPLIAFNVWLSADVAEAKTIAARVREPGRVRALGLPIGDGRSQVSMNLIAPEEVSIEDAFDRVDEATPHVIATEIVGLVEERLLPDPDAKAARLLIEPGRSLESALGA